MNARYYVPNTNRWLSPDSIVPNPANPQSFNRYSYVRNNPVNFNDPSGHLENCALLGNSQDILGCQNPSPPSLPLKPPAGLSDRPYGSDAFESSGPGGQQAYDGLKTLQDRGGGWWGDTIDAEEALMMLVNHEFGNLYGGDLSAPNDLPPKVRELIIRRYNEYCSGGAWSATCLNSFWAYSEPITNVVSSVPDVSQSAIDNLREHPRYSTHATQLANTAHEIFNSPNLGGENKTRPFHWATVNVNNESWGYWLNVVNSNDPKDELIYWYYWPDDQNIFLTFSPNQYPGTVK